MTGYEVLLSLDGSNEPKSSIQFRQIKIRANIYKFIIKKIYLNLEYSQMHTIYARL